MAHRPSQLFTLLFPLGDGLANPFDRPLTLTRFNRRFRARDARPTDSTLLGLAVGPFREGREVDHFGGLSV